MSVQPSWTMVWIQAGCPSCEEINWVSMGESVSGGTAAGVDGIVCHKCQSKMALLAPGEVEALGGMDELYVEQGQPKPSVPE